MVNILRDTLMRLLSPSQQRAAFYDSRGLIRMLPERNPQRLRGVLQPIRPGISLTPPRSVPGSG
jgi:hypothetical protein